MPRMSTDLHKEGTLFIVSAPAGTGKTTLVERLIKERSNILRSISYTTRPKREKEEEGRDYHFVQEGEFLRMREEKSFLECANIYGNWYGTPQEWVDTQLAKGKHVVLVIDTQGAEKVMARHEAVSIFLQPPSLEELQRRLEKRGTETPESLQRRMEWAKKELTHISSYDYTIVNCDMERAYQALLSIVTAEEHRIR